MAEHLDKIGRTLTGLRQGWCPPADVYKIQEDWVVKLELPGIKVKDLKIILQGDVVTIKGHRRDCSIESGQVCYSMEISYDEFERTLRLPFIVEHKESRIIYRDGMLFIHFHEKGEDHEQAS